MTKKEKPQGTTISFRPFFERIATENKRMAIVFHFRQPDAFNLGQGCVNLCLETALKITDPSIIDRKEVMKEKEVEVTLIFDTPATMNMLTDLIHRKEEDMSFEPFLVDENDRHVGKAWLTYDSMAQVNPIVAACMFINEVLNKPIVSDALKKEIGLELEKLGDTYLAKASAHQRMIIPVWKDIFRSCHQEQSTRPFPPEALN